MSPAPGKLLGECEVIQGTAQLAPNEMLITTHRNLTAAQSKSVPYHAERIRDWENPGAAANWSSNQYFHHVGATYQVRVAVVPRSDVAAAVQKDPRRGWAVSVWPQSWKVVWDSKFMQSSTQDRCP